MSEAPEGLVDALQEVGEPRSYSGRGMDGASCLAIALDDHSELFRLGFACGELGSGEHVDSPHLDALGLGIVAYWPEYEWSEEYA
jgi:hypothetical protein